MQENKTYRNAGLTQLRLKSASWTKGRRARTNFTVPSNVTLQALYFRSQACVGRECSRWTRNIGPSVGAVAGCWARL
jgi:hypothetical protein